MKIALLNEEMTPRPVLGALLITALTLLCLAWRLQMLRLVRETWCPVEDVRDAHDRQETQDEHTVNDAQEAQNAQERQDTQDALEAQHVQEVEDGKKIKQCEKVNNVVFLKTHKVTGMVPFL